MENKLKIAYVEIDTHAEIAQNFMEIIANSKKFETDFYFSEKILNILNLNETKNILKINPKNILKKLENQHYDLIIIGTVHRYFNTFYKIVKRFPCIIIGHNLNFIKASDWQLFLKIFKPEWKFRLKLLLKEGLLLKNKIYKSVKTIAVLSTSLENEKFKYIPLFFNKFNFENHSHSLKILIPGAVSQKRRDYLSIIEKIKKIKKNKEIKIDNTLEFIFLGKAENKELEWLRRLKTFLSDTENIKIYFFTKKIPQPSFDKQMNDAHLLWCPIQRETLFFDIKEFYEKTKISGNISDAIKYSKPAILPDEYIEKYPFAISEVDFFSSKKIKEKQDIFNNYEKEKILIQLEHFLLNLI